MYEGKLIARGLGPKS